MIKFHRETFEIYHLIQKFNITSIKNCNFVDRKKNDFEKNFWWFFFSSEKCVLKSSDIKDMVHC